MSKKAFSTILVTEALESMGFTMASTHIRRLAFFTSENATRTATVKTLQKAVAQYRIDPLKLLETKGIGRMTLLSVQQLHDLLAAKEVQKEFGVADNLAAVQTILNTCNRGVPERVRNHISKAKDHITDAQNYYALNRIVTVGDSKC